MDEAETRYKLYFAYAGVRILSVFELLIDGCLSLMILVFCQDLEFGADFVKPGSWSCFMLNTCKSLALLIGFYHTPMPNLISTPRDLFYAVLRYAVI